MAKPQPWASLGFGGTATSSGLVTTSSSTGPSAASAHVTASSSCVGLGDAAARQSHRGRDGGEVGVVELGPELRQAALLLLELDHAEPAVVEDDEDDGQPVGHGGAQVAEQHHQSAVAGEGDDGRVRSRACAPSAIGIALAIEPRL